MPSVDAVLLRLPAICLLALSLELAACRSPQASKDPPVLGDPINGQATPQQRPGDQGQGSQTATTQASGAAVTDTTSGLTAEDIRRLFPLEPRQGVYRITKGPDAGKDLNFDLQQVEDGQWRLTYEGLQATYFKASPQGLLITREDDFGEKVQVTYDPAINCLPLGLSKDTPFQGKTRMTVRGPNGETRDSGSCDYTVTLLGKQRVTTPAGGFDAVVIRNIRTLDLAMADVVVDITSAYAAPQGEVIEHVDQKTQALGLFGLNKLSERRLVELRR